MDEDKRRMLELNAGRMVDELQLLADEYTAAQDWTAGAGIKSMVSALLWLAIEDGLVDPNELQAHCCDAIGAAVLAEMGYRREDAADA